ncbi:uncharacterized [Tachysurus ichikawai]
MSLSLLSLTPKLQLSPHLYLLTITSFENLFFEKANRSRIGSEPRIHFAPLSRYVLKPAEKEESAREEVSTDNKSWEWRSLSGVSQMTRSFFAPVRLRDRSAGSLAPPDLDCSSSTSELKVVLWDTCSTVPCYCILSHPWQPGLLI